MCELTVMAAFNRAAEVVDLTTHAPYMIRQRIKAFAESPLIGLSEEDSNKCQNAGLQEYWKTARSNAHCIGVGCDMARRLSGRYRVPVRNGDGPKAA